MPTIDLRSDTVTLPTPQMRETMHEAPLGDDVYGEDPTVRRLEEAAAQMTGLEAAVFTATGTQGNLVSLLSHCQRGDEYIAGHVAHLYRYEGGGGAVLGSIQPQPVQFEDDATLDLAKVAALIKPADSHFARTRLLCLENTQAGRVVPLPYFESARRFVDEHNLKLHLDGARVFNAAVRDKVSVSQITQYVDSVSICLSKGLGCPAGTVVCGDHDFVAQARRWRKMLGGGMRQAGVIAAAGLYALNNHVDRLAQDHEKATRLARQLSATDNLIIDETTVQTNMVFVTDPESRINELQKFLNENNIRISSGNPVRLVTHLDITNDDIDTVTDAIAHFYNS